MHSSTLSDEAILALGPVRLENRYAGRYLGQGERVELAAFAPGDRTLLHQAYSTLLEFHHALKSARDETMAGEKIVSAFVHGPGYQTLAIAMSHLGHATASAFPTHDVDRLVHDLRGGAYQALSFQLQLFPLASDRASRLTGIYFLLRDHLKIMRNCVADLDPARFAADSSPTAHHVSLLVEKWSRPEFSGGRHGIHIDLQCRFAGTLCESCLEFSSLDRIIYNLMNNAAKYSADGAIVFNISGVPLVRADAVRFVVANAVSADQKRTLVATFGHAPGELFRGGFTTGGHGAGARICADFCRHAFGIADFDEALNAGYFGARWIEETLPVWFHWPIVAN